jgi:flagellar motility protein MotE (MotC chaperone)
MGKLRAVVIAGMAFKVVVVGAWWWMSASAAASAAKPVPAAAGAADDGVPHDLLVRSRGFRDLLEAVRQRGTELDERAQAVATRETAMKALEKTLGDEIARLEGLSKTIAGRDAGPGGNGAAAGPALTKVYESMKPDEAGPIFDRLDDTTVKGILRRMKERQVGAILAAMSRDRAVALTKALAADQPRAAKR